MKKLGQQVRRNGLRLGLGAAAVLAVVAGSTSTPASAMQVYKWKNRPLLVFAPAPGNRGLTRQRRIYTGQAKAFRERDIVVISVIGGQLWSWLGPGPGMTADQLRRRFGVGRNDFRAILVGKDGGVKLSSSEPISAQRLFRTIDAMPMRRREMRERR